jgi:hypothetical protein
MKVPNIDSLHFVAWQRFQENLALTAEIWRCKENVAHPAVCGQSRAGFRKSFRDSRIFFRLKSFLQEW